jgi:hypothetical protein
LKPSKDNSIKTGVTLYGCADAACILYTLDELPAETAEREAWIEAIGRFQNPETGMDPTTRSTPRPLPWPRWIYLMLGPGIP